jgi:hypothetical protein
VLSPVRNVLLVDEAVSMGTTFLRAGTLAQHYRDHSQQLLRQSIDARIDLDKAAVDNARVNDDSIDSKTLPPRPWSMSMCPCPERCRHED